MNIMNKKRLFIVVSLIVCGILITAVVWIFNKRSNQTSLVKPVTSVTSSTSPISTVGMKTYTNTAWGFEFQYPEDWSFEINSFYSPFSKFNLQGNSSGTNYNPFYPDFLINIVTSDFVERQFSDLKNIASEINIGGIIGLKYEYKEGEISHTTIILPFEQFEQHKIILGFGANKEYEKISNQILASFKFLNKAATYRNEQYGFEYQYPPSLILKEKNFPVYIFTDSGEVCKNLLQKESKSRRLLHETAIVDPSTKYKVEVVTISVYGNLDNLSLDDWLNSGTKFLEKYSEECKYDDKNYIEIRLNNKKSVTIDKTPGTEGFSGCCMVSNKNIYLAKNNKIYKLRFSGSVNDDLKCAPFSDNKYSCPTISEDVYNQILASFKFLK